MDYKNLTSINLKNKSSSSYKKEIDCEVSKASNEIMLDRVCDGNVREFPFLN